MAKSNEDKPKKKATKKKTTKKKIDGRKKPVDPSFHNDFVEIANQIDAKKTNKEMVPIDKAKKIAQQEYQKLLLENGKDLEPLEVFVCEQLALGKTPEITSSKYGVSLNLITSTMLTNPLFVQKMREMIMNTGTADKIERIKISKGILDKLQESLYKRMEEGDLDQMKFNQLHNLYLAESTNLAKLLDEDKQKKSVNLDISVAITQRIAERHGKEIDITQYDPNSEFPVIDVDIIDG